jgi:hypothetical protein
MVVDTIPGALEWCASNTPRGNNHQKVESSLVAIAVERRRFLCFNFLEMELVMGVVERVSGRCEIEKARGWEEVRVRIE